MLQVSQVTITYIVKKVIWQLRILQLINSSPSRLYMCNSHKKDAQMVLKKLKKEIWGTPTIPNFFNSLGVLEHEKNNEHALFVAKLFADLISI